MAAYSDQRFGNQGTPGSMFTRFALDTAVGEVVRVGNYLLVRSGFLLGGDERFLENFGRYRSQLRPELGQLKIDVADNPAQLLRLNRMTPDDLGLAYESLTFRVRDLHRPGTIDLAAWWMPREGARRPCSATRRAATPSRRRGREPTGCSPSRSSTSSARR